MCGALWNTLTVLDTSQTEPHLFTRPISTPRCSRHLNYITRLQLATVQLQTWRWQFPKRRDNVPLHGGTTRPDSWFTTRSAAGPQTLEGSGDNQFFFLWRVRKIAQSNYYLQHVCPSVRMELGGFSWNLILEYFLKICRGNSSFVKISIILRMRNVSEKKF